MNFAHFMSGFFGFFALADALTENYVLAAGEVVVAVVFFAAAEYLRERR